MYKHVIVGIISSFFVLYPAYSYDSICELFSASGSAGGVPYCLTDSDDDIFLRNTNGDIASFSECSECQSGYKLESTSTTLSNGCYVTYDICVPECPNDVDCPDGYKDGGSTFDSCTTTKEESCYQKCSTPCQGRESCPSHATCTWDETSGTSGTAFYPNSCNASSSTCPVSTITCEEGYYKNGNTCDRCPLADDIYTDKNRTIKAQYTSSAGATSKSQCYLPSGTTYYDAKGTFTFNATCNYK